MNEIVTIINEVGFPIAATLGLGFFLWKLLNKIVNGMEQKIDVVDDKINESLQAVEKRLDSKLDSQTQILIQLIDRVRSVDNEIIRQDILLKTILGVPNLIEKDKIAKANQKDLKMTLEHELKTQLQTANLAQIEVNKIEAASKNWFVAGWRPSVGWVCSLAMMYHFILAPMIQFAVGIAGIQVELPEFDFSQLSTILMAMLGMAGLRTFEKKEKVTKGN